MSHEELDAEFEISVNQSNELEATTLNDNITGTLTFEVIGKSVDHSKLKVIGLNLDNKRIVK